MELNRIETILDKYFQGETSISEEKELKIYFSSSDVEHHLEQYKPLFGYFSEAAVQEFKQTIPLPSKKHNVKWLSIAASVVVLLGISTFTYLHQPEESSDLGTYESPEAAFEATQKALSLLSENVNVGIQSVSYINEFQNSKELIFKINK
jgi:hypothetical protein